MDLVIVESPTKAKTLTKFLGKGYKVMASLGHVRDLPKSKFGIDVEHGFEPDYTVPIKARPVVKSLREEAEKAEGIWLSSDPDREGEAIAWHTMQVLAPANSKFEIRNSKFRRAVFHEITESAVKEAFDHPRSLDLNLVNSQQARRVLDRIVGYRLSPLLWKKVARNLSAGRVQSVAVRLVVERERERNAFKPKEYWSITAALAPSGQKDAREFSAELSEKNGKKIEVGNESEAAKLTAQLQECSYRVTRVETAEKRRYPSPPFTTSTLQQAAGNRAGFAAARTMKAAQGLYEKGLITYHRTDSVSLSEQFLNLAQSYIASELGRQYLPESPVHYKTKARLAQEAHEAIRPTSVGQISNIKNQISNSDEWKIYELIYNRAIASQMVPAVYDSTSAFITAASRGQGAANFTLKASGSILKFEGWLKAWGVESGDEEADAIGNNEVLPPLTQDAALDLLKVASQQHFTEPRPRYTEASLVKALEENGIGRPSTYAPIISTIQKRGYVGREGRYLFPMDVGVVVNDLLVAHFPKIVDVNFTSQMEEDLDQIAEGKKEWVPMIANFYGPFEQLIKEKEKEIKKEDVTTIKETEEICPQCGKPLIVKLGRFGNFLSCTGFPDCKYARPSETKTPGADGLDSGGQAVDQSQLGKCPQDAGELVLKQGRFGKFIACSNYPDCKFTKPYLQKVGLKCPLCGEGDVVYKKSGKGRPFYGCSRYPECKYASWTKPGEKDTSKQPEAK